MTIIPGTYEMQNHIPDEPEHKTDDDTVRVEFANSDVLQDKEEVEPSDDSPRNPQNWSEWKKNTQILLSCFHALMAGFMAAGLIPAYGALSERFHISLPQASYLVSSQILVLGISPPIWNALTKHYGRFHLHLYSVAGSMVCNIGAARCNSFPALVAIRILLAFLISPPLGIGSGVVTDLCPPDRRAEKLGWWVLLSVLGTPCGPLFMGFVTERLGLQWIFWIFSIMNCLQVIAYVLWGEETIYRGEDTAAVPRHAKSPRAFLRAMFPRRNDSQALHAKDFVSPLLLICYPRILIPALAAAVAFCYGHIALMAEMPIYMTAKFHFSAEKIGLQFIAVIIGSIIGEQVSGPMSDWFMKLVQRRRGCVKPADRLWLSYIGFGTLLPGILVWGFGLQAATTWNVIPCVGIAIASFGVQILMTILTTYSVDHYHEKASEIGVFINLLRLVFGFTGPFYLPHMFSSVGLAGTGGVMCAIIFVFSIVPVVILHAVK